jgi:uncharacterized protein (UPF0276 family)
MRNLFSNLGVGLGIRAKHTHLFLEKPPKSVQWGEVISENYMDWGNGFEPRNILQLEKIRQNIPVALHGVSMNLGSADNLDMNYLSRLKKLVDRIQPKVVSDHLCWTGVDGENLHDLMPVPFTEKNLNYLAERILRIQDFLGQRILIENVSSYFEYNFSEMTEWEFLKRLLEKADCGILLDINNVFVSSINHNFNAYEFLLTIPRERIGQIHLAGHTKLDGHLIDTHDEDICPEVWSLYQWSVKNLGQYSTMLERDDNIPEWNILEKEILKIYQIQNEVVTGSQNLTATI